MGLSLDDYYVDREKTLRDAKGEYDFEALEALDLAMLDFDLRRIFAGETVKTARYDFMNGESVPVAAARTSRCAARTCSSSRASTA